MSEPHSNQLEQLEKAFDLGVIDQATYDAAASALAAQLSGSGAIAQGATAMAGGAGSVLV